MMELTPAELEAELRYRREERLGILAEDKEPTPEQEAIADRELREWLNEYQKELLGGLDNKA